MKLISCNVNGLRALHRKNQWNQIFELEADIICLQETKSHPDQLPDELRSPFGYHAFFDHSKLKKGYSGVAIYSKIKPEKIEYGLGIPKFDDEGRTLVAYFPDFVLLNVYFPNGGGGPERLKYKLEYYQAFLKFINKLRKEGHKVIFTGDVNTAHTEIDLARPKENSDSTGFLPIERAWIDKVIADGYVDTFRNLHPEKIGAYSYWDMKTFSRERNVGWRIDYFFVSKDLLSQIKKAEILDNVYGSDHCPVSLELK
jgi:exodeoxyribonuclease-3